MKKLMLAALLALPVSAFAYWPVASVPNQGYQCVLKSTGAKYETMLQIIDYANVRLADRRAQIETTYREEMSKLHCDTCAEAGNRLTADRNDAMARTTDQWLADLQDQCYIKGCNVICE